MERVATRRLVDATAELEPADRALVALWIHHGFDDDAVAGITGIPSSSLATRRARVIDRLSETLGLPPDDVSGAFASLGPVAEAGDPVVGPVTGADAGEPHPVPPPGADLGASRPVAPPGSPVGLEILPERTAPRSRRRASWRLLPVLAIAALAGGILDGSGAAHRDPRQRFAPASRTVAGAVSGDPRPLAAIPGALPITGASGAVAIVRRGGHLELSLKATGLPRLSHGHYEVWLYTSIIDSRSLGTLSAATATLTAALPPSAGRYRWIDVEREPPGDVNPSGESVLRASNPV